MSIDETPKELEPKKPGMSSAAKVLLTIVAVLASCVLLCCGGIALVFTMNIGNIRDSWNEFAEQVQTVVEEANTRDPDEIRQRTSEIVTIDIPPNFEPDQSLDLKVYRWVVYSDEEDDESYLVLMEVLGGGAESRDQLFDMVRQQLPMMGHDDSKIQVESTEKRTLTVRGAPVEFEFRKGKTSGGEPVREVVGTFATPPGKAVLVLRVSEAKYDEAAVLKMIASIGDPVKATATSPTTAPDDQSPKDAANDKPAEQTDKP